MYPDDNTKTGNEAWSGFDIGASVIQTDNVVTDHPADLLKVVARRLNFTYGIHLQQKPANVSWDNYIITQSEKSNLHLSYWVSTPFRRGDH